MRFVLVLALVLGLAAPAAADPIHSVDQAPCAFVVKRDVSDEKARRRCGLPDGEVWRSHKAGRVIIFVT